MIGVIDQTSLAAAEGVELLSQLGVLVQLVSGLRQNNVDVYKWSEIYALQVVGDTALYEVLFESLDIDRDFRLGVTLMLERSPNWDERWELHEIEADWGAGPTVAPTIAFAHRRLEID